MLQEPGATIRIDGELYRELRAIAEARDCTLRQAMDFYVDRGKRSAAPVEAKRPQKRAKKTDKTDVTKDELYKAYKKSHPDWSDEKCREWAEK